MKIETKRTVKASNVEQYSINIEFDPTKEREEGYAALIATMVDTIKRTITLEKVIDEYDRS